MSDLISWSPGTTLEEVEKQVILKAFRHFRGNKTVTSNALGISVRTLDTKLEKYETDAKANEQRELNERAKREEFQRRSRGIPAQSEAVLEAGTGLRMESAAKAPAQYAMSLSERQEIQSVPSKKVTHGRTKGHS